MRFLYVKILLLILGVTQIFASINALSIAPQHRAQKIKYITERVNSNEEEQEPISDVNKKEYPRTHKQNAYCDFDGVFLFSISLLFQVHWFFWGIQNIPKKMCDTINTANNSSFVIMPHILRNETNFFWISFFTRRARLKIMSVKNLLCRCNESPCKILHISFQTAVFDYFITFIYLQFGNWKVLVLIHC